MKIQAYEKAGFTLVEIMVVVGITGLLSAIAVPNFVHARSASQAGACIGNLRQIESAVQLWALENNKSPSSAVDLSDVQPYLGHGNAGRLPVCPVGGAYSVSDVSSLPACSVGSTATPAHELSL